MTYTTYDTNTIHEDYIDMIFDVSPTDTPFISMIAGTGANAENTLHEWTTDELDAATAANARVEGEDKTATAITAPVRLNNQTQISDKTYQLSGTTQAVRHVESGIGGEMNRQTVRKGLELKRDMETISTANQAKAAGNASTARNVAAIPSWLTTNTDFGATGADPTGDGSNARTDGTQRPWTEAILQNVTGSIWNNSGEAPDYILLNSFQKRVFSDFAGRADQRRMVSEERVAAAIDIYIDDFNFSLSAIPERYMRQREVFVLNSDYWVVNFLPGRQFAITQLAKTGDSDKENQLCEWTIESRNEKASGGCYDLNDS